MIKRIFKRGIAMTMAILMLTGVQLPTVAKATTFSANGSLSQSLSDSNRHCSGGQFETDGAVCWNDNAGYKITPYVLVNENLDYMKNLPFPLKQYICISRPEFKSLVDLSDPDLVDLWNTWKHKSASKAGEVIFEVSKSNGPGNGKSINDYHAATADEYNYVKKCVNLAINTYADNTSYNDNLSQTSLMDFYQQLGSSFFFITDCMDREGNPNYLKQDYPIYDISPDISRKYDGKSFQGLPGYVLVSDSVTPLSKYAKNTSTNSSNSFYKACSSKHGVNTINSDPNKAPNTYIRDLNDLTFISNKKSDTYAYAQISGIGNARSRYSLQHLHNVYSYVEDTVSKTKAERDANNSPPAGVNTTDRLKGTLDIVENPIRVGAFLGKNSEVNIDFYRFSNVRSTGNCIVGIDKISMGRVAERTNYDVPIVNVDLDANASTNIDKETFMPFVLDENHTYAQHAKVGKRELSTNNSSNLNGYLASLDFLRFSAENSILTDMFQSGINLNYWIEITEERLDEGGISGNTLEKYIVSLSAISMDSETKIKKKNGKLYNSYFPAEFFEWSKEEKEVVPLQNSKLYLSSIKLAKEISSKMVSDNYLKAYSKDGSIKSGRAELETNLLELAIESTNTYTNWKKKNKIYDTRLLNDILVEATFKTRNTSSGKLSQLEDQTNANHLITITMPLQDLFNMYLRKYENISTGQPYSLDSLFINSHELYSEEEEEFKSSLGKKAFVKDYDSEQNYSIFNKCEQLCEVRSQLASDPDSKESDHSMKFNLTEARELFLEGNNLPVPMVLLIEPLANSVRDDKIALYNTYQNGHNKDFNNLVSKLNAEANALITYEKDRKFFNTSEDKAMIGQGYNPDKSIKTLKSASDDKYTNTAADSPELRLTKAKFEPAEIELIRKYRKKFRTRYSEHGYLYFDWTNRSQSSDPDTRGHYSGRFDLNYPSGLLFSLRDLQLWSSQDRDFDKFGCLYDDYNEYNYLGTSGVFRSIANFGEIKNKISPRFNFGLQLCSAQYNLNDSELNFLAPESMLNYLNSRMFNKFCYAEAAAVKPVNSNDVSSVYTKLSGNPMLRYPVGLHGYIHETVDGNTISEKASLNKYTGGLGIVVYLPDVVDEIDYRHYDPFPTVSVRHIDDTLAQAVDNIESIKDGKINFKSGDSSKKNNVLLRDTIAWTAPINLGLAAQHDFAIASFLAENAEELAPLMQKAAVNYLGNLEEIDSSDVRDRFHDLLWNNRESYDFLKVFNLDENTFALNNLLSRQTFSYGESTIKSMTFDKFAKPFLEWSLNEMTVKQGNFEYLSNGNLNFNTKDGNEFTYSSHSIDRSDLAQALNDAVLEYYSQYTIQIPLVPSSSMEGKSFSMKDNHVLAQPAKPLTQYGSNLDYDDGFVVFTDGYANAKVDTSNFLLRNTTKFDSADAAWLYYNKSYYSNGSTTESLSKNSTDAKVLEYSKLFKGPLTYPNNKQPTARELENTFKGDNFWLNSGNINPNYLKVFGLGVSFGTSNWLTVKPNIYPSYRDLTSLEILNKSKTYYSANDSNYTDAKNWLKLYYSVFYDDNGILKTYKKDGSDLDSLSIGVLTASWVNEDSKTKSVIKEALEKLYDNLVRQYIVVYVPKLVFPNDSLPYAKMDGGEERPLMCLFVDDDNNIIPTKESYYTLSNDLAEGQIIDIVDLLRDNATLNAVPMSVFSYENNTYKYEYNQGQYAYYYGMLSNIRGGTVLGMYSDFPSANELEFSAGVYKKFIDRGKVINTMEDPSAVFPISKLFVNYQDALREVRTFNGTAVFKTNSDFESDACKNSLPFKKEKDTATGVRETTRDIYNSDSNHNSSWQYAMNANETLGLKALTTSDLSPIFDKYLKDKYITIDNITNEQSYSSKDWKFVDAPSNDSGLHRYASSNDSDPLNAKKRFLVPLTYTNRVVAGKKSKFINASYGLLYKNLNRLVDSDYKILSKNILDNLGACRMSTMEGIGLWTYTSKALDRNVTQDFVSQNSRFYNSVWVPDLGSYAESFIFPNATKKKNEHTASVALEKEEKSSSSAYAKKVAYEQMYTNYGEEIYGISVNWKPQVSALTGWQYRLSNSSKLNSGNRLNGNLVPLSARAKLVPDGYELRDQDPDLTENKEFELEKNPLPEGDDYFKAKIRDRLTMMGYNSDPGSYFCMPDHIYSSPMINYNDTPSGKTEAQRFKPLCNNFKGTPSDSSLDSALDQHSGLWVKYGEDGDGKKKFTIKAASNKEETPDLWGGSLVTGVSNYTADPSDTKTGDPCYIYINYGEMLTMGDMGTIDVYYDMTPKPKTIDVGIELDLKDEDLFDGKTPEINEELFTKSDTDKSNYTIVNSDKYVNADLRETNTSVYDLKGKIEERAPYVFSNYELMTTYKFITTDLELKKKLLNPESYTELARDIRKLINEANANANHKVGNTKIVKVKTPNCVDVKSDSQVLNDGKDLLYVTVWGRVTKHVAKPNSSYITIKSDELTAAGKITLPANVLKYETTTHFSGKHIHDEIHKLDKVHLPEIEPWKCSKDNSFTLYWKCRFSYDDSGYSHKVYLYAPELDGLGEDARLNEYEPNGNRLHIPTNMLYNSNVLNDKFTILGLGKNTYWEDSYDRTDLKFQFWKPQIDDSERDKKVKKVKLDLDKTRSDSKKDIELEYPTNEVSFGYITHRSSRLNTSSTYLLSPPLPMYMAGTKYNERYKEFMSPSNLPNPEEVWVPSQAHGDEEHRSGYDRGNNAYTQEFTQYKDHAGNNSIHWSDPNIEKEYPKLFSYKGSFSLSHIGCLYYSVKGDDHCPEEGEDENGNTKYGPLTCYHEQKKEEIGKDFSPSTSYIKPHFNSDDPRYYTYFFTNHEPTIQGNGITKNTVYIEGTKVGNDVDTKAFKNKFIVNKRNANNQADESITFVNANSFKFYPTTQMRADYDIHAIPGCDNKYANYDRQPVWVLCGHKRIFKYANIHQIKLTAGGQTNVSGTWSSDARDAKYTQQSPSSEGLGHPVIKAGAAYKVDSSSASYTITSVAYVPDPLFYDPNNGDRDKANAIIKQAVKDHELLINRLCDLSTEGGTSDLFLYSNIPGAYDKNAVNIYSGFKTPLSNSPLYGRNGKNTNYERYIYSEGNGENNFKDLKKVKLNVKNRQIVKPAASATTITGCYFDKNFESNDTQKTRTLSLDFRGSERTISLSPDTIVPSALAVASELNEHPDEVNGYDEVANLKAKNRLNFYNSMENGTGNYDWYKEDFEGVIELTFTTTVSVADCSSDYSVIWPQLSDWLDIKPVVPYSDLYPRTETDTKTDIPCEDEYEKLSSHKTKTQTCCSNLTQIVQRSVKGNSSVHSGYQTGVGIGISLRDIKLGEVDYGDVTMLWKPYLFDIRGSIYDDITDR